MNTSIRRKLTLEEVDVLEDVLTALEAASKHFVLRDQANAVLHLTPVRYSPITLSVQRAASKMVNLLDGPARKEEATPIEELSSQAL